MDWEVNDRVVLSRRCSGQRSRIQLHLEAIEINARDQALNTDGMIP